MKVWTLSVVVFVLAFGPATADHVFSCKDVSFDSCSCSTDHKIETTLHCPRLSVQLKLFSRHIAQLQCTSSNSTGYTSLSGLQIGNVNTFVLDFCSLPDYSFNDLMERIGISHIKRLHFHSYSNLNDTLQKKHFEKLFDVTRLNLNNNGLTTLPGNIFEDMGNLTWIDLTYNNIVDLPQHIFYFTPMLELLNLANNNLTFLNPGIFKNLSHLKGLNIGDNMITNLTRSVFSDVPNLLVLLLTGNCIENIEPDVYADLINLEIITLDYNHGTCIHRNIPAGNIFFEEFRKGSNKIYSKPLPPGLFSNLSMLYEVSIIRSMINTLPENIFSGSKNIEKIYLHMNSLSTLPREIFTDIENLRLLDLSVNNIEHLPEEIFHHNLELKYLHLDHNDITEIPPELFSRLQKLEYLNLSFNKIKSITGKQFYGLSSLKYLHITDNQLTSLAIDDQALGPYSVFHTNTQLEHLILNNNLLTEIYQDWRLVLKNLRYLHLKSNQLRTLKTNDLVFSGDIELNLSNNNISLVNFWDVKLEVDSRLDGVNSSYVWDSQRKSKVILNNNPFHCDCQMLPFIQYLRGELIPEAQHRFNIPTEKLECSTPEKMVKMSLKNVPYNSSECEFKNNTESAYICPERCTCHYRTIDMGNIIRCENIGLKEMPASLPTTNIANHTELYLGHNQLTELRIPKNQGYENVTHLSLAGNKISSFNISEISEHLKVLDLSNNNLTSISWDINSTKMPFNFETLVLSGNPWECFNVKILLELVKNNETKYNVICADERS